MFKILERQSIPRRECKHQDTNSSQPPQLPSQATAQETREAAAPAGARLHAVHKLPQCTQVLRPLRTCRRPPHICHIQVADSKVSTQHVQSEHTGPALPPDSLALQSTDTELPRGPRDARSNFLCDIAARLFPIQQQKCSAVTHSKRQLATGSPVGTGPAVTGSS